MEKKFELTEEELKVAKLGLEYYAHECKNVIDGYIQEGYFTEEAKEMFVEGFDRINNLINRINQFQNDNSND